MSFTHFINALRQISFFFLSAFLLACLCACSGQETAENHAEPDNPKKTASRGEGDDVAYVTEQGRVFLEGQLIPQADAATFAPLGGQYGKDARQVYYGRFPLPGADPASFTTLKDNFSFAKDSRFIYRNGCLVPGADPATFRPFAGTLYSKDARNVFFENWLVQQADPVSFTPLSQDVFSNWLLFVPPFAKDASHLYAGVQRLGCAAPENFIHLDQNKTYATDGRYVFGFFNTFDWADPATFRYLGGRFAQDRNQVWHGAERIKNVSPGRFTHLCYDLGKTDDALWLWREQFFPGVHQVRCLPGGYFEVDDTIYHNSLPNSPWRPTPLPLPS